MTRVKERIVYNCMGEPRRVTINLDKPRYLERYTPCNVINEKDDTCLANGRGAKKTRISLRIDETGFTDQKSNISYQNSSLLDFGTTLGIIRNVLREMTEGGEDGGTLHEALHQHYSFRYGITSVALGELSKIRESIMEFRNNSSLLRISARLLCLAKVLPLSTVHEKMFHRIKWLLHRHKLIILHPLKSDACHIYPSSKGSKCGFSYQSLASRYDFLQCMDNMSSTKGGDFPPILMQRTTSALLSLSPVQINSSEIIEIPSSSISNRAIQIDPPMIDFIDTDDAIEIMLHIVEEHDKLVSMISCDLFEINALSTKVMEVQEEDSKRTRKSSALNKDVSSTIDDPFVSLRQLVEGFIEHDETRTGVISHKKFLDCADKCTPHSQPTNDNCEYESVFRKLAKINCEVDSRGVCYLPVVALLYSKILEYKKWPRISELELHCDDNNGIFLEKKTYLDVVYFVQSVRLKTKKIQSCVDMLYGNDRDHTIPNDTQILAIKTPPLAKNRDLPNVKQGRKLNKRYYNPEIVATDQYKKKIHSSKAPLSIIDQFHMSGIRATTKNTNVPETGTTQIILATKEKKYQKESKSDKLKLKGKRNQTVTNILVRFPNVDPLKTQINAHQVDHSTMHHGERQKTTKNQACVNKAKSSFRISARTKPCSTDTTCQYTSFELEKGSSLKNNVRNSTKVEYEHIKNIGTQIYNGKVTTSDNIDDKYNSKVVQPPLSIEDHHHQVEKNSLYFSNVDPIKEDTGVPNMIDVSQLKSDIMSTNIYVAKANSILQTPTESNFPPSLDLFDENTASCETILQSEADNGMNSNVIDDTTQKLYHTIRMDVASAHFFASFRIRNFFRQLLRQKLKSDISNLSQKSDTALTKSDADCPSKLSQMSNEVSYFSATLIQKLVRIFMAKSLLRALLQNKKALDNYLVVCITKIQCLIRKKQARTNLFSLKTKKYRVERDSVTSTNDGQFVCSKTKDKVKILRGVNVEQVEQHNIDSTPAIHSVHKNANSTENEANPKINANESCRSAGFNTLPKKSSTDQIEVKNVVAEIKQLRSVLRQCTVRGPCQSTNLCLINVWDWCSFFDESERELFRIVSESILCPKDVESGVLESKFSEIAKSLMQKLRQIRHNVGNQNNCHRKYNKRDGICNAQVVENQVSEEDLSWLSAIFSCPKGAHNEKENGYTKFGKSRVRSRQTLKPISYKMTSLCTKKGNASQDNINI